MVETVDVHPSVTVVNRAFEDSSNEHRSQVKIDHFLKVIFGEILLLQDYLSYSDVIQNLEVKSGALL